MDLKEETGWVVKIGNRYVRDFQVNFGDEILETIKDVHIAKKFNDKYSANTIAKNIGGSLIEIKTTYTAL